LPSTNYYQILIPVTVHVTMHDAMALPWLHLQTTKAWCIWYHGRFYCFWWGRALL